MAIIGRVTIEMVDGSTFVGDVVSANVERNAESGNIDMNLQILSPGPMRRKPSWDVIPPAEPAPEPEITNKDKKDWGIF